LVQQRVKTPAVVAQPGGIALLLRADYPDGPADAAEDHRGGNIGARRRQHQRPGAGHVAEPPGEGQVADGRNLRDRAGDGKRLVSGGWDLIVREWDAATGKEEFQLEGTDRFGVLESVAISADG